MGASGCHQGWGSGRAAGAALGFALALGFAFGLGVFSLAAASAAQPDLFTKGAASISQRALAGFIDESGAPLPHPSQAAVVSQAQAGDEPIAKSTRL